LRGEAEAISFLTKKSYFPDNAILPIAKKIPTRRWGLKKGIAPSGLSGAGLVFGVFDLKPIVAYTKANPLRDKCGNKRSV
jgi:hypothetical protein